MTCPELFLLESPPPPLTPFAMKYAMVTKTVMLIRAPAAYASEVPFQLSLVAKKNELMICGPAIITNASGRVFRMSDDRGTPPRGRGLESDPRTLSHTGASLGWGDLQRGRLDRHADGEGRDPRGGAQEQQPTQHHEHLL